MQLPKQKQCKSKFLRCTILDAAAKQQQQSPPLGAPVSHYRDSLRIPSGFPQDPLRIPSVSPQDPPSLYALTLGGS